jgi:hypothetical protein
MAINIEAVKVSYVGNGTDDQDYPIPFKYLEVAHVKVYADDVDITSSCAFTGDGTVNAGAFTTNVAYASSVTIDVCLEVPFDQPVTLQETGTIPAKTIEVSGFDRLNMQIRRVWRRASEALTFSTDGGGASTGTADTVVGFDSNGNIVEISREIIARAKVTSSDTPPLNPETGDLWFNSTNTQMFVYYDDDTSSQWVTVTAGTVDPDSKTGWIDYNDTSGSFAVAANTWTDVPNNGAGAFTNKAYRPTAVSEVIDTATGYLDFSELPLGSELILRNDVTVTPNSNNALFEMRYLLCSGAGEYGLSFLSERLDSGSGIPYQKVSTFPIYMGDTNTKGGAGRLQVRLSVAGTVTNSGVYASIQLF